MYMNCKYNDCVINCLSNFAYFYVCKLAFTTMRLTIHQASSRDCRYQWPRVPATKQRHLCVCVTKQWQLNDLFRIFSTWSLFSPAENATVYIYMYIACGCLLIAETTCVYFETAFMWMLVYNPPPLPPWKKQQKLWGKVLQNFK